MYILYAESENFTQFKSYEGVNMYANNLDLQSTMISPGFSKITTYSLRKYKGYNMSTRVFSSSDML